MAVSVDSLVESLATVGVSVSRGLLDASLVEALQAEVLGTAIEQQAGVGRQGGHLHDASVRSDHIRWIDGESATQRAWLDWCDGLRLAVNRALFLGLFDFESHFAHYAPQAFYQRHLDAFAGQSNRRLSLITYLNDDWQAADGGELLIYSRDGDLLERVLPQAGTLVVFLSEQFPHEVLPATRDRYSIAGWFRVNASGSGRVDPAR